MTYAELLALYPTLDRIMDRLDRSIDIGLDASVMLAWAEAECGRIKDYRHQRLARAKVRLFVEAKTGGKDYASCPRVSAQNKSHPGR